MIDENVGETVDTTATNDEVVEQPQEEQQQIEESVEETPKTFTQDQVNDFVRNRIEKERNRIFRRYGVENKEGLDELIGRSQAYDVIKERYDKLRGENQDLNQKLAFVQNNVDDSRKEDVLAYFKGKEMKFDNEALAREIETHPEWRRVEQKQDKPVTTIKTISPERGKTEVVDEKEVAAKMFGLKTII